MGTPKQPAARARASKDQNRASTGAWCILRSLAEKSSPPNHDVPMNIVIVFNAESLVALLVLVRMLQHLF